jgi:hypothetical protein
MAGHRSYRLENWGLSVTDPIVIEEINAVIAKFLADRNSEENA